MKIEINMAALKGALAKVGLAVQARAPISVLSHVMLSAEGSTLTMRGTDLDVGVEVDVDCTVHEGGEMTLPYDRLRNAVSNRDEAVCIESADTDKSIRAKISVGSFRHMVPCLRVDDFPPISAPKKGKGMQYGKGSLDAELLDRGVESVRVFASNEANRALMCGVNFECADGKLMLTATDGRRMARYLIHSAVELPRLTLPARSAEILARLLPEEGQVTVEADERMMRFDCGDCTFVSKLVEGNFPNAGQIIKQALDSASEWTELDCAAAKFALDRVGQITEGGAVRMECTGGALTVTSARSDAAEEASDSLAAEGEGFALLEINSHYVSAAMLSAPADKVRVASRDAQSPFVLQNADGTWLAVVMPLRLS